MKKTMKKIYIIIFAVVITVFMNSCKSNTNEPEKPAGKGNLKGELQDQQLFTQALVNKPELADWTPKEICDGTTGATIQQKTLRREFDGKILLGDQIMDIADGYGQYGFEIEAGTYEFTAEVDSYSTVKKTITVEPNSTVYLNFFMNEK